MQQTFFQKYKHLLLILFVPAYVGTYFLVESIEFSHYNVMYSPLDDLIPFCSWSVIFYLLWFPMLVFTGLFLLLRDKPAYKRYMWFLIITFATSAVIWLVYPSVQNLRPTGLVGDDIFTRLVLSLYGTDTPTNVFPSVHVLGCAAYCYAGLESKAFKHPAWRITMTLGAVLTSCSTVLMKQHSIVDSIASLIMCVPVIIGMELIKRRQARKEKPSINRIIETERLILRPYTLNDVDDVFEWVSDPEVNKFMRYSLYDNKEQVKEWISGIDKDAYEFIFCLKETGKAIGGGGIVYHKDTGEYELGYNLNRSYWKQGYTTEASKAMIKWAYDELGARNFIACHANANTASGNVIRKCGFKFVGFDEYSSYDKTKTFESSQYKMHLD